MSLSNELISLFVKATNDKPEEIKETTHYGTTVYVDDHLFVQLDGSDVLTPVATISNTKVGERVIVTIKNHTAIITGNVSSPSARLDDLDGLEDAADKIAEFEIIIADKADTADLNAANARIDDLVSDNVLIKNQLVVAEADIDSLQASTLEIRDELTATNATITQLETDKLDASIAKITYATIDDLEATNADLYKLEATYGDFADLTTNHFAAIDATIDNLDSTYASIEDLDTERARIDILEAGSLSANSALIKQLQADVADIDTLIFGSAGGTVIQTSFANAVVAQLGNAQIKSAMIESISADKITAGDIITNNVRVMSEDGKLLISDETIQISDDTRVRVQIGKDAAGDYSINIWDADGNLMFSEGGITDSAIKEAIIRDDMVSDTANISAHKLNIESLFEEINGSSHSIKSSKIFMDADGQTLDVVFTDLTSDVVGLQDTVSSQGTSLSVIQGEISSKVWQQDIDTAISDIEVGGRNLFGFHKNVAMDALAQASTLTKNEDTYGVTVTVTEDGGSGTILLRLHRLGFDVINSKEEPFTFSAIMYASAACEVYMDICDVERIAISLTETPQKISFTAYPAATYASADSSYRGFVDLEGENIPVGTVIYLEKIKIERGTIPTDFTVAPEDLEYITDDLSTKYSSLEQTIDGITATVAEHSTTISNKADANTVTTVEEKVANLELTTNEFKTEVAATYATKNEIDDVNAQVSLNKTSIEQNTSAIALRATKTEMENLYNDLDVGGRNLLLATSSIIEMPETEEFVSYSKYKVYKFSPIVSDDVKAFLLSLKNGEPITLSFEFNVPRTYKDSSLSLSRLGAYMPFLFTHTDGTKLYWYGTHSAGGFKTNRHTIENVDANSLVSIPEDETSYVGRYSCHISPSETGATLLTDFYANPDNYIVSCAGVAVEFNGFTTGGTLSKFKMELGNKATDWTPAPEDLETRVDTAEAQINVNADNIASVVSRTTENEKAISTLEQTATGLTSRVSTVEDAAIRAQTDIDELEIGGRNLACNTANAVSHTFTTETGTDSWSKCNQYLNHGILLEVGETYTLSFDYEFDWGELTQPTEAVGIGAGIGSDDGTNAPGSYIADTFSMMADYWKYGDGGYGSGRFVYTFTNSKSVDLYFAFRMARSYNATSVVSLIDVSLTVSNFKLEIGNRATDWTPAPEDMATSDELETLQSSVTLTEERVTTTESLIQQLSDSIAMLVTDGNGESLMVQTETGWTFSTSQIQNTIDATSASLNSLTNEMGDVNSTVNALQQAVDDLGVLNDYVKIGTYENEPCIELGESDSDFKLLITNTRIMFMEGSGVPAYFNNQSMFIKNAVIEQELQQGEFVWKARSNGNLGLIWKGGV